MNIVNMYIKDLAKATRESLYKELDEAFKSNKITTWQSKIVQILNLACEKHLGEVYSKSTLMSIINTEIRNIEYLITNWKVDFNIEEEIPGQPIIKLSIY